MLGRTVMGRLTDMLPIGDNGVGGRTAAPPDFYFGGPGY